MEGGRGEKKTRDNKRPYKSKYVEISEHGERQSEHKKCYQRRYESARREEGWGSINTVSKLPLAIVY